MRIALRGGCPHAVVLCVGSNDMSTGFTVEQILSDLCEMIRPRASRAIAGVAAERAQPAAARPWLRARERYIENDLLRRSGAVVLSASRGGEFSYESDTVRNGFFTAAIIRALKSGGADRDGDKAVSTDELLAYVHDWVAAQTGGCQNPTIDRDNTQVRISFPVAGSSAP